MGNARQTLFHKVADFEVTRRPNEISRDRTRRIGTLTAAAARKLEDEAKGDIKQSLGEGVAEELDMDQ